MHTGTSSAALVILFCFHSMTAEVKKDNNESIPKHVEDFAETSVNNEPDDEFVSESHQASSKDMAEADEAMKKLGISDKVSLPYLSQQKIWGNACNF